MRNSVVGGEVDPEVIFKSGRSELVFGVGLFGLGL